MLWPVNCEWYPVVKANVFMASCIGFDRSTASHLAQQAEVISRHVDDLQLAAVLEPAHAVGEGTQLAVIHVVARATLQGAQIHHLHRGLNRNFA